MRDDIDLAAGDLLGDLDDIRIEKQLALVANILDLLDDPFQLFGSDWIPYSSSRAATAFLPVYLSITILRSRPIRAGSKLSYVRGSFRTPLVWTPDLWREGVLPGDGFIGRQEKPGNFFKISGKLHQVAEVVLFNPFQIVEATPSRTDRGCRCARPYR